jgi:hypothetical protein
MRLNDEKNDKIIHEIKQRINQLIKTFDENQDLNNKYENKDFIERKSVEELSNDLKQFQNELFCLNKMIELHENGLKINSFINKKGLIYVENSL